MPAAYPAYFEAPEKANAWLEEKKHMKSNPASRKAV